MVFVLQLLKKNGILRLKPGTKVLLSDPMQAAANASWIVPMGCLNELHYKLEWKDGKRTLFPKYNEKMELELHGAKILQQMEAHQIQLELKKLTLQAIMQEGIVGFENKVKVKEVFPSMPDELAMKLVPDLHVLKDPAWAFSFLGTEGRESA